MKFTALAIAALAVIPAAFVQAADDHYYYEKDYYKEEEEHKDDASGKKGGESGGKKGGGESGKKGDGGGSSGGESGKKGGSSSSSSGLWKLNLDPDDDTTICFDNGEVIEWYSNPGSDTDSISVCRTGGNFCYGGDNTAVLVDTGSDYLELSVATDCRSEDPFLNVVCPDKCDDMKIVKSSCEFVIRPPPKHYYKKYRELADGGEVEDQTLDEADRELQGDGEIAEGYYKKGGYCYWYLAYDNQSYELELKTKYPPDTSRCFSKSYIKLACGKGFRADGDDGDDDDEDAGEAAGLPEIPELASAGTEAPATEAPSTAVPV